MRRALNGLPGRSQLRLDVRQAAALLRLLLLGGCLCALLLAAGLLHRADRQAPRSLLPAPAARSTGLPFAGVTIDLAAYAPEDRPRALAALAQDGFGWVRQRFDWGASEPQRGVYDWGVADAYIDAITDAGLAPLVVLDGSPAWARAAPDRPPNDNPFAPPADPADLARFAAAFAARYGSRVRFYQVWDEPNIAPHWGNRLVEPVAYAQLLRVTATAIRAADPDAVVAAAALAPTADRGHTAIDEVFFWQRLVAAGAADAVDALAIQPFGFGQAPARPPQSLAQLNFRRAALLRRELVAMGLGDKPLWAVRSGWNRLPNPLWGAVTAADQARYAADAFTLAWQEWPWLEALGWAIDRPAAAEDDPLWGFALHTPDGAPAPLLAALQVTLASLSGAARPQAQPPGSGELLAFLLPWLALAGGLALVAWRAAAAARLLPWAGWIGGWRRLPWPVQALGWGLLLLLYHLAAWPPLIGLCWLLWALLCLAQPAVGLALAAGLLPFYFQHKELHLVNTVVAVPPAAAAAACLLPALLLRARRVRWRPAGSDVAALALLGISLLPAARAWQWPAFGRGLFDLVLTPLLLWFAVRVLVAPGSAPVRRRHAVTTQRRSGENPTWPASARLVAVAGFHPTYAGAAPASGEARLLAELLYGVALALFAGGVLVAAWGLLAWIAGEGVPVDGVLRLVGPHYSPNHTALYLLRTLFLGVGLLAAAWAGARRAAKRRADTPANAPTARPFTLLLAAATALVLLALVLTGSRGALLLGLPAGALVLGVLALRRQPGLLRWLAAHPLARSLAAVALPLLAVAALLLWDRLLNRQTLSLRIDLWEASLRLWRDHLLLGVGPGGFFWNYPAYLLPGAAVEPNQLHPHNVWLEVATTWGLLGFAWLGLLVWQAAAFWQARLPQPPARAWLTAGLLSALAAAFAHAQMDAFFLLPDLAAWNLLALALVSSREIGWAGETVIRPPVHHSVG